MFQKMTLIVLLLAIVSCKDEKSNSIEQSAKADFLVGNWESKTEFGTLTESWIKASDSTFTGKSYFITLTNDTLHSESITLKDINENLVYEATVKGQNEDKAVAFALTNSKENSLTFENLKHDYPQKITYTKKSSTNLTAEISGKQKGELSSEKFEMTKK